MLNSRKCQHAKLAATCILPLLLALGFQGSAAGILYIDNSNASTIERYDAATGSFLSSFYIRSVVNDLAHGPSNGVPLVNTLALFGLGLAGLGAVRRKKLAA